MRMTAAVVIMVLAWLSALVSLMLISSFASTASSAMENVDPELWGELREYAAGQPPFRAFVGTTVEVSAVVSSGAWLVAIIAVVLLLRSRACCTNRDL